MKNILPFGLVLGVLALLQIGVLPVLTNSWPTPNLLLLFVLFLSVLDNNYDFFGVPVTIDTVLGSALVCGFLLDILTPTYFFMGFWILTFMSAAALVRFVSHKFIETGINYKTTLLILLTTGVILPLLIQVLLPVSINLVYSMMSLIVNFLAVLILGQIIYVRTGTHKFSQ